MTPDASRDDPRASPTPDGDGLVAAMAGWIEACLAHASVSAPSEAAARASDRVTLETTFELIGASEARE